MAGTDLQERSANVVLTADVDPYRQSVQAAGRDTVKLTDQVDKLTKSLDRLAKSAGTKLMLFGAGTTAGVTATTFAFAKFEKQMTSLRVNAEVTGRSYATMEKNVNNLRKTYGLATSSAVELQKTILGFKDSTAPVEKLTNTFVKLGAATGEAPQVLAQSMLQLQRSMGLPQRDTDKLANTFADLSIRSGVSASSLINFSQAIAPIGRIAGMTTAEIAGVSTAFSKAGQDGYQAANAFNKMLSDIMTSVQTGSPDLAKYANLIGVTVGQFKDMNKTEAITQVFDEINRMGPEAIGVLNRLGLDGMRMQRAIAGVSQQSGGIGGAISQAVAAYNAGGDNALQKGSRAGLEGVSDQMARLGEQTKMFGESIGSSFSGPAKLFIGLLEKMAGAANFLGSSWLGKAGAWAVGLAGGVALATGALLKMSSALGALALFRSASRNFATQGFTDAQTGAVSASGAAIKSGNANWVNRAMYTTGGFLGRVSPDISSMQPNWRNRLLGAPLGVARMGTDMIRSTFSPLLHPFDPSQRARLFATTNEIQGGRASMGMFSNSMVTGRNFGYNMPTWLQNRIGFTPPPIFGGLGANAAGLGRSMLGLTGAIGGAAVGATAVGGMAAARGLGSLGRGAMAIGGGVPGLAIMGALGGAAALSSINKSTSLEGIVGTGSDNNLTLMDAYNAAVGKATTSLQDFSTALESAAKKVPRTRGQATVVTEDDIALASVAGRELTATGINNLTTKQAGMLARSQFQSGDPAAIQEMKLDLIQAFGADQATGILKTARGGGQFSTQDFMSELFSGKGGWLGLKGSDEAKDQFKFLETEIKRQSNDALGRGGLDAMAASRRSNVGGIIASPQTADAKNTVNDGEYGQTGEFLNRVFFGGKAQFGVLPNKDIKLREVSGQGSADAAIQSFYKQLLSAEDSKAGVSQFLGNMGLTRGDVRSQLAAGSGSIFDKSAINMRAFDAGKQTSTESFEDQMARTSVGRLVFANPKIRRATEAGFSADQNVQIQATDELVGAMRKQGMSYSEIDRKLIQFQNRVQDASDPLYQLAQNARGVAAQQQSFAIPYMGTGQRFGLAAQSFTDTELALRPGQGNLKADAATERLENLKAFEAQKASMQQWLEQQYIAQREFNISQSRAQEDFALSRTRAEDDYLLSRQRAERQFSISRKDAFFDYHLSRKRAEADFHHQQELMVKQSAQSMMNVYDRVMVQRTWSGSGLLSNADDQLERMRQQKQDLNKVRKMGLSKDAIQQLGLGQVDNAQQLTRLLEDAQNNPSLIRRLNKNMKGRLGAAKDLVTDSSNPQWEEMNRQFKLNMERGEADFKRGMARNKRNFNISMDQAGEDFARSMDRMASDFAKQQGRAQKDLLRMQKEITWDLEKTLEKSADHFGGYIDKVVDKMVKDLERIEKRLDRWKSKIEEGWAAMPGISQFGSTPMDRHGNPEALGVNASGKGMTVQPRVPTSGPLAGGTLNQTNVNGPVTVVANDPKEFGDKAARDARRKKLVGGKPS